MTIDLPAFDEVSDAEIAMAREQMASRLKTAFPSTEVRRGVIRDHVIQNQAIYQAARQLQLDRYDRSSNLRDIQADPALSDPELVDKVLSNFLLTRRTGAAATGNIRIVISELVPITVATGTIFEGGGQNFVTTEAYSARIASSAVTADTDRVIEALQDGTYAFTIPLTAQETGIAGLIRQGTKLAPLSVVPYFVTAYAESDFVDGSNTETTEELLARLDTKIPARGWSHRDNVAALTRGEEAFEDVLHISVIGMADPEMRRDDLSIFPVSLGGRVDVYVRSQGRPQLLAGAKLCTLVEQNCDGTVWQFSLDKEDAPGFYDIRRVALPTATADFAGYEIIFDRRDYDLTDADPVPDLVTTTDAVFSRFQTGVFRFVDTDKPSGTVGETATYVITARYMPLIAEIHDFLASRGHGEPAGDMLVKAAIPCFVRVEATLLIPNTTPSPDLTTLQQAVADAVNSLEFPGLLYSSQITKVLQEALTGAASVSAIDLHGEIRSPASVIYYLRSTEVIQIPNLPAEMISGRTTAFLLDPQDVILSISRRNFAEI